MWDGCLRLLQTELSSVKVVHTEGSPDMSTIFEDGFDYLGKWEQEGKLRGKKRKDLPKPATSPKETGDPKKRKWSAKSNTTGEP